MQPEQGHRLAGPTDGDAVPPRPAEPDPPAGDPVPPRPAEPGPPATDPAPPRPAEPGAPLSEPRTFRLPGAIVAWWAWLILAPVVLADIAFTGRNHTAAEIAATPCSSPAWCTRAPCAPG